jgi:cell division protein FtsL
MPLTLRLNLVLVLLVVSGSIWLIRSSNEARTLFVALGRAQVKEKELAVENDRLQAERRTAATPLVVEGLVRKRLNMFNVRPDVTHYIKAASAASAGPVGPADAEVSHYAQSGVPP